VFAGHKTNDTVLWFESQRAVISGDTLVDFGHGLEINERWLRPGVTREEIAAGLRPLLDLPVEHVLATHGGPTDLAALERALSSS
jgi:glyoxylase-like metal-dependent hydrolase (beta-lactamase superfamily II)